MFKPTYLYIKTHNITGLKYFGKTTRNPMTYPGSGKYWRRHIAVHGNNARTDIVGYYTDRDECVADAVSFSILHNIVESDAWANLKDENGLDGGFEYVNTHGLSGTHKARIINTGKKREKHSEFMKNKHKAIPAYAEYLYITPLTPDGGRWQQVCDLYTPDMMHKWMKLPDTVISKQAVTLLRKALGDKVSYSWVGKTRVEAGFYRISI